MAKVVVQVMNKRHARWEEFCEILEGPAGCNFAEKVPGDINSVTWSCSGVDDFVHARKIMTQMGLSAEAIIPSLKYFHSRGGHCDCEILFNVA